METKNHKKQAGLTDPDFNAFGKGLATGAGVIALIRALGLAQNYIGDIFKPKFTPQKVDIYYDKTKKDKDKEKRASVNDDSLEFFIKESGFMNSLLSALKSGGSALKQGGSKIKEYINRALVGNARAKAIAAVDAGTGRSFQDVVSDAIDAVRSKRGVPLASGATMEPGKYLRQNAPQQRGIIGLLKSQWHGKSPLAISPEYTQYVEEGLNKTIIPRDTWLKKIAPWALGLGGAGLLLDNKLKGEIANTVAAATGNAAPKALFDFNRSRSFLDSSFWTGLGLIPGLYGAHKGLTAIEKILQDREFANKAQDIEERIYRSTQKKKDKDDEKEAKASYTNEEDLNFLKHAVVKAYMDGFNNQLGDIAQTDKAFGQKSKAVGDLVFREKNRILEKNAGVVSSVKALIQKYPALIGALIPAGFLTGLSTAGYMFPTNKFKRKSQTSIMSEEALMKDIVKRKKKKQKEEKKKQEKLSKAGALKLAKTAAVADNLDVLFGNGAGILYFNKVAEEDSSVLSAMSSALPYLIGGGAAALGANALAGMVGGNDQERKEKVILVPVPQKKEEENNELQSLQ